MMINPNEPRSISSIDLLQERFRQLQKMKELRQEKELLRMLSESAERSPPSSYTPPPVIIHDKYNYHHELMMMPSKKLSAMVFNIPPNKPHNNINDCQLSLSLWPDSSQHVIKRPAAENHPRGIVGPPPSNVVLPKTCFADAMLKLEGGGSDVDTSLRL